MKFPKVYLFAVPEVKTGMGGAASLIQDDLITLAEGFNHLGIQFYSNVNYWLLDTKGDNYLIKRTPDVSPSDCDIVVFSYQFFHRMQESTEPGHYLNEIVSPDHFINNIKAKTVCFDFHDGYVTFSFNPEFKIFDYIFRAKFNQKCFHPSNHIAWHHSISARIIKATENFLPFTKREKAILWNFGASHPYMHPLRGYAQKKILPLIKKHYEINDSVDDLDINDPEISDYDKLMWQQAARRHSPHYYQRLKTHIACATFCGDLIPALPHDPSVYLRGGKKARLLRIIYDQLSKLSGKHSRSIQWDSWRFWESLAAGCVPIHIDLEKYGVELPVMPQNWKHYVGLDLDHPQRDIDRLQDIDLLEKISTQGHQWLMENYTPPKIASRFLKHIGYEIN